MCLQSRRSAQLFEEYMRGDFGAEILSGYFQKLQTFPRIGVPSMAKDCFVACIVEAGECWRRFCFERDRPLFCFHVLCTCIFFFYTIPSSNHKAYAYHITLERQFGFIYIPCGAGVIFASKDSLTRSSISWSLSRMMISWTNIGTCSKQCLNAQTALISSSVNLYCHSFPKPWLASSYIPEWSGWNAFCTTFRSLFQYLQILWNASMGSFSPRFTASEAERYQTLQLKSSAFGQRSLLHTRCSGIHCGRNLAIHRQRGACTDLIRKEWISILILQSEKCRSWRQVKLLFGHWATWTRFVNKRSCPRSQRSCLATWWKLRVMSCHDSSQHGPF